MYGRMKGGHWHGRFRGCGYRLTVPRKVIMDVLSRTSEHLSAEEIYMKVHRVYPHVGLTTVYRTLELLVQMGIVSRFDFGEGKARYELEEGSGKGHHHHLVCTECNKVIDYTEFIEDEVEFIERTEKGLSKKYGFEIDKHVIQFYGRCRDCVNVKK